MWHFPPSFPLPTERSSPRTPSCPSSGGGIADPTRFRLRTTRTKPERLLTAVSDLLGAWLGARGLRDAEKATEQSQSGAVPNGTWEKRSYSRRWFNFRDRRAEENPPTPFASSCRNPNRKTLSPPVIRRVLRKPWGIICICQKTLSLQLFHPDFLEALPLAACALGSAGPVGVQVQRGSGRHRDAPAVTGRMPPKHFVSPSLEKKKKNQFPPENCAFPTGFE